MNEREYEALKRQIEGDYQKKLDALELLWNMARVKDSQQRTERTSRADSITGKIKAVVAAESGEFDLNDVRARLKEQYGIEDANSTTISGVLIKMRRRGEIEMVSPGSGRSPNIFRRQAATELRAVG